MYVFIYEVWLCLLVNLLNEHDDPVLNEWCCRAVTELNVLEGSVISISVFSYLKCDVFLGVNAKFRSLGGCELVVMVLQRQVKLPEVSV